MRRLIFISSLFTLLSACAGVSGYTPMLGRQEPEHNERYWPPYNPAQAFPAQIMDGGSHD